MTEADLVERLRAALAEHGLAERAMFGGVSFLVDGSIAVAARRGGSLLVRVLSGRSAALLARPGASVARMGQRSKGEGWLEVAPEALDDEALDAWLREGVAAAREASGCGRSAAQRRRFSRGRTPHGTSSRRR